MSIRKADYIAKYGEEAWAVKSAKDAKRNKMWKEANKERVAEYNKQYYNTNKEYFVERMKQYYNTNKEYYAEQKKQWQKDNKERVAELNKQYREANRNRIAEQRKQHRGTQWGRANNAKLNYIKKDKKRGYSTDQNIDENWIIENIFGSQCIYCGDSDWTHLGADRIDNTKGHTPDNCVCACRLCNTDRNDNYSVEEFKEYRRTHPRKLGGGIEKSWEIVEQNGVRVIKKKIG